MFTMFLDWIKPMIVGFANAWAWLNTPFLDFKETTWEIIGQGTKTIPAWSLTPISVISITGLTVLFIFGVAKTILDALPVV